MAYRADFYCVDNIIGYTEGEEGHPTVYFETGAL
jgi:hypothetical protein